MDCAETSEMAATPPLTENANRSQAATVRNLNIGIDGRGQPIGIISQEGVAALRTS